MQKLTLPQFIYFRHLRTYKRNKATLLHEELLPPVTGFRPPGSLLLIRLGQPSTPC
jgi:hypothetical protein